MPKFKTKARAIDLLGKNQIADLPTAITELWKNGYDAYGDILEANLYEKGYKDTKDYIFTLSDDGHGMTKDDLENKWAVLGTDNKKNKSFSTPIEDRFGKEVRIPLGEKGIGRLSVAYLGDHFLLITKKVDKPFELLFMNWKILNNLDLYVEDINIPTETINTLDMLDVAYNKLISDFKENLENLNWNTHNQERELINYELERYREFPNFLKQTILDTFNRNEHGTIFVIFDPIEELVNIGEDRTTAQSEHSKHVRASITALFNPFDKKLDEKRKKIIGEIESPSFYYYKKNMPRRDILKTNEFFTREDLDTCENWIKGEFNDFGEFKGDIKVLGKELKYNWNPKRLQELRKYGKIKIELAFFEVKSENSTLSDERRDYYKRKSDDFGGLYIYRDGFRVLPYGRTDYDFLEFEKRRSMHAGSYYFSHRRMLGYLGISKRINENLIDKSGREGFISNNAYRELKEDLIEFFVQIAKEYYGTHADTRQEHLGKISEKKEKERLIENEKKINREELIEFRKELKEKEISLKEFSKEIAELNEEINRKQSDRLFVIKERNEILEKIDNIKLKMSKLEIIKPARLEINDVDRDKIYEHDKKIAELDKILEKYNSNVIENTYINDLKEYYEEKYKVMYADIYNAFSEYEFKLKEITTSIKNSFENIRSNEIKKIEKYAPSQIGIEEKGKEETNNYLNEIERIWNSVKVNQNEKIFPFIDYLEKVNFDKNDEQIIGVYKEKVNELGKKVEALHELAQLGMSIEIIDHEFNVLYSQIADALRNFYYYFNHNNENLTENYKIIKTAFEHLENNHKLLVPLYRTMRKNKREIKGNEIEVMILNFFEKSFVNENINFIVTDKFRNYKIYTYESIINPVFINVINNALFWLKTKKDKIIEIDLFNNEILIMNSGEKMSYTDLANCFELFFSKRPGGRGIGLYLAKTNLRTIGMDIRATDDKNYNKLDGACFVISEYKGEN